MKPSLYYCCRSIQLNKPTSHPVLSSAWRGSLGGVRPSVRQSTVGGGGGTAISNTPCKEEPHNSLNIRACKAQRSFSFVQWLPPVVIRGRTVQRKLRFVGLNPCITFYKAPRSFSICSSFLLIRIPRPFY
jgi:hypothetical protein